MGKIDHLVSAQVYSHKNIYCILKVEVVDYPAAAFQILLKKHSSISKLINYFFTLSFKSPLLHFIIKLFIIVLRFSKKDS